MPGLSAPPLRDRPGSGATPPPEPLSLAGGRVGKARLRRFGRALAGLLLPWRRALAAVVAGGAVALVIGIPTDVVPNPWFTRMTPVRTLDVVFLAATAVVLGLLAATYVVADRSVSATARGGITGGLLSWLAVGCPICNKLVVALAGVSGALTYFGPLQPILGAGGVALGLWALRTRIRALAACPVAPSSTP